MAPDFQANDLKRLQQLATYKLATATDQGWKLAPDFEERLKAMPQKAVVSIDTLDPQPIQEQLKARRRTWLDTAMDKGELNDPHLKTLASLRQEQLKQWGLTRYPDAPKRGRGRGR